MTYRVVFDLMQSGYRTWWFPMFGVAFLVVASVVVVARRRGAFVGRGFGRVLPYGLLTFAAIWTSGAFMATYGEYRHLVAALQNGEAQVVEGIVTDFKPIPPQGHADERFTVAGHTFSYSDYVTTSAFHTTRSHGGPIRAGLRVRVTYVGNSIVRLEIAD